MIPLAGYVIGLGLLLIVEVCVLVRKSERWLHD
jgi:hypothetical protein